MARLAQVSTSTVSYALSGARPISATTRRRIEQAMRELGYTPNALASGLAGRRTKILALLLPSHPRIFEGSDLRQVVAAADLARERGYHLVVWTVGDGELREMGRFSDSGLVDGILLMGVRLHDDRIPFLKSSGLPLAMIGRTADPTGLIYADADYEQITQLGVDHLAALGHRCLALLGGSPSLVAVGNGPSVRVPQAAAAAAHRAGVALTVLDCENTVPAGRAALHALLGRCPRVTAIISANWEATVGLIQQATADGRSIPGDLSVVSITDADNRAEITTPALTTITPPAEQIARAATNALIDHLERPHDHADADPHLDGRLFPGAIVERGSTGPPAASPHAQDSSG